LADKDKQQQPEPASPLWAVISVFAFAATIFVLLYFIPNPPPRPQIAFSDFIERVEKDEVRSVTLGEGEILGEFTNGDQFRTRLPEGSAIIDRLLAHRVRVEVDAPSSFPFMIWGFVVLIGVLIIGLLAFAPSNMSRWGGEGDARGFGRSRAKLIAPDKRQVTLADVAGIDEAEEELKEIVEFLKNPQSFQALGGKMPKGCLLIGPPGTGKTLLARAIAGEANVPFYTISGSDFVEMFVGVGAARVRDMFAQAKQHAPCIIFVDELDAVGRKRGLNITTANDEREQTLNQLLVEMDGFDTSEGIVLLAATNRPDILDPALLRPGRFDRQIVLSNPDLVGRQQILKVHLRKVPTAPDVDVAVLARGTPGLSGADLANIVNEAALLAARRGKRSVGMAEFEQAKDKVLMGLERRSVVMSEREKQSTAYHEAGHALVTYYTPGSDPLHKVTIIPRGRTLGVTMSLPERDRYGFTKKELEAKLDVMFGGRVAEELIFGKDQITTGAADDIRRATELARKMVTEFGFSERVGPLHYQDTEEASSSSALILQPRDISPDTARIIDEEVRRVVEESKARAQAILAEHVADLHRVAKALLANETLTGPDVRALLSGAAVIPFEQPLRNPVNAQGQV
jgi:cell division protease FtsH